MKWESGNGAWGKEEVVEWERRLFAKRVEAGEDRNSLEGFGEGWEERLAEGVGRSVA